MGVAVRTREREKGGKKGGRERWLLSSEGENRGQTFLWAKLQCLIICVFALLVGQCEWPGAVIDGVI